LSNQRKLTTFKGRSIGIVVLIAAQMLIGVIHVFFGALLLVFENLRFMQATVAYDVYTMVFGLLTLVFAVLLWQGKKSGWAGTIAVSVLVIFADALALLDLPSIPGIPSLPALTEIAYSLLIVFYLLQGKVREQFWSRAL
jgi:hypothetical protein